MKPPNGRKKAARFDSAPNGPAERSGSAREESDMWYFKYADFNGDKQSTDPECYSCDAAARQAHVNSASQLFLMGPYPSEGAALAALDKLVDDSFGFESPRPSMPFALTVE